MFWTKPGCRRGIDSRLRTSTARANVEGVVGGRWARRAVVTDFQMKALSASSVERNLARESWITMAFKASREVLENEKYAHMQSGAG